MKRKKESLLQHKTATGGLLFCTVFCYRQVRCGLGSWEQGGAPAGSPALASQLSTTFPHSYPQTSGKNTGKGRVIHTLPTEERNRSRKWNVFKKIRKETEVFWKRTMAPWKKTEVPGKEPGCAVKNHPQPNFSGAAGSREPLLHRALRQAAFLILGEAGIFRQILEHLSLWACARERACWKALGKTGLTRGFAGRRYRILA